MSFGQLLQKDLPFFLYLSQHFDLNSVFLERQEPLQLLPRVCSTISIILKLELNMFIYLILGCSDTDSQTQIDMLSNKKNELNSKLFIYSCDK